MNLCWYTMSKVQKEFDEIIEENIILKVCLVKQSNTIKSLSNVNSTLRKQIKLLYEEIENFKNHNPEEILKRVNKHFDIQFKIGK